jgi:hypothetical protein
MKGSRLQLFAKAIPRSGQYANRPSNFATEPDGVPTVKALTDRFGASRPQVDLGNSK